MLLDLSGTLASLLCTYYLIRLNRIAWILGLAANLINGWLYWHNGIYADTLLEVFYLVSTAYGWLKWQQSSEATSREISSLSFNQWLMVGLAFASLYFLIVIGLKRFTSTTVADLDAFTTALSLIAQVLMCHKVLESWLLWLVTDSVYAYLYWLKQLPFHVLLMIVYTGMALTGYWIWIRQQRRHRPSDPVATPLPYNG
ncbi:Nicotinamide riboside transporter PnuC [Legionella rubrilucens]|uniref:Nicotinamide riboside transporter PnuC n=1 Tax=Legionella rubrilucens TaxID=458 RepID=A0A0W0XWQ7_9GAMM|nr:nicotinamide riboside transporter PnuC [Legionella rubrilucens]KTD48832.1 Nicotinamide riboside transporter PnuC [Legionella rubrilucens]